MRTEIRELLTPIYGEGLITDHDHVDDYPKVPGIIHDLYFFDHLEEETTIQSTMSKYNTFEAKMCSKLAAFLVKVGVHPRTM